jgi:predicted DNA-binding transcriptional regulator YafY
MAKGQWTIVSNHGLVLLYLAGHTDSTVRGASDALGITERQVFRIVRDLSEAGVVQIQRRRGRSNVYAVNLDSIFRQPALSPMPLRQLVKALAPSLIDEQMQDGAPGQSRTAR